MGRGHAKENIKRATQEGMACGRVDFVVVLDCCEKWCMLQKRSSLPSWSYLSEMDDRLSPLRVLLLRAVECGNNLMHVGLSLAYER